MFDIPFLDLPPLRTAGGTVLLPGSKSISNRALLLSALAQGSTRLQGLLYSDDTSVMLDALQQLGCAIQRHDNGDVTVTGLACSVAQRGSLANEAKLFLGNAGTAMRPLLAMLAIMGGDFYLHGVERMHERPIGDLVDALRSIGCAVEYAGNEGFPPLRIGQSQINCSQPIRIRGDVSSQFLTALLMALPLAAEGGDIHIDIVGELISKPYIAITLRMMQDFGVHVQPDTDAQGNSNWRRFTIAQGSQLLAPASATCQVEPDASSASYFIALGALLATAENPIIIEGLGSGSVQGDVAFAQAAQAMGAQVQMQPERITVSRGSSPLRSVELDCNHIPDAAMTLAVMALYASGSTTLRNIASWRVKETDRIAAMSNELRKLGATVEAGNDWLRITPPAQWQHASVATYDDHRMAMCFALAACAPRATPAAAAVTAPASPSAHVSANVSAQVSAAADAASDAAPADRLCPHPGIRIQDPACVAKTFPDFFETLFAHSSTDRTLIPVITVDGPSASGKGSLAQQLAQQLGYHYLDSGALYRVTAYVAQQHGVDWEDADALAGVVAGMRLRFEGERLYVNDLDVGNAIRTPEMGRGASKVSQWPVVRQALHDVQLNFRQLPGLVADGRDMGTVIFPDAQLKVFLTASVEERAKRRHKQLAARGISVTIDSLCQDLAERDERDRNRSIAPLRPAQEARHLDNSTLSIETSVQQVLRWWQAKR